MELRTMSVDPFSRLRLGIKRLMQALHLAAGMVEFCHDCGKRQPLVWWARDDLWEQVSGGKGVLCPRCFSEQAYSVGLFLYWIPVTEDERRAMTEEHDD